VIGTTLNRMIFWELVRVFLLSLGTLTGLFLIVGLVHQASQLGLTLSQLLRVIPLFIPSSLPLTIPATTLFASCVVYGRLAHDNEVVALKAAGVHLFVIVKPAVLLGLITSAVTAGLYHTVIPRTQQMFYAEVLSDPEEVLYNMLRRDRCLRSIGMPYVLYVRDVQGRRLLDMVVKRRQKARDPKTGAEVMIGYDYVARAREAQLHVDLVHGKMSLDADRWVVFEKGVSGVTAHSGPLTIELPDSVSGKESKLKINALTWGDIPVRVAALRAERDELLRQEEERTEEVARIPDATMRAIAQNELKHYKFQVDIKTRQLRNIQAEVYARPALAVSCLVFALIGCPVGVWANRSDYLSTFVICFLPTLVVYYPLLLAGSDAGKNGRLPLGLGCWTADIVMGGIAVFLTWRLLRR
jgi:lipopolysaccharide export system permease protein